MARVSTKWCLLRNNAKLRTAINLQLKNKGWSFRKATTELVKVAGHNIDHMNVYGYINGTDPKGLTQWDVVQLAKLVGLNVDLYVEYQD